MTFPKVHQAMPVIEDMIDYILMRANAEGCPPVFNEYIKKDALDRFTKAVQEHGKQLEDAGLLA